MTEKKSSILPKAMAFDPVAPLLTNPSRALLNMGAITEIKAIFKATSREVSCQVNPLIFKGITTLLPNTDYNVEYILNLALQLNLAPPPKRGDKKVVEKKLTLLPKRSLCLADASKDDDELASRMKAVATELSAGMLSKVRNIIGSMNNTDDVSLQTVWDSLTGDDQIKALCSDKYYTEIESDGSALIKLSSFIKTLRPILFPTNLVFKGKTISKGDSSSVTTSYGGPAPVTQTTTTSVPDSSITSAWSTVPASFSTKSQKKDAAIEALKTVGFNASDFEFLDRYQIDDKKSASQIKNEIADKFNKYQFNSKSKQSLLQYVNNM